MYRGHLHHIALLLLDNRLTLAYLLRDELVDVIHEIPQGEHAAALDIAGALGQFPHVRDTLSAKKHRPQHP